MSAMKHVTEAFGSMLREMLEAGFQLPFHMVAIGVNGAYLLGTYTAADDGNGLACEFHAQHGDFRVPVNIMVVDGRGEAARIVIGPEGERSRLLQ
jgi:hypothetical protein